MHAGHDLRRHNPPACAAPSFPPAYAFLPTKQAALEESPTLDAALTQRVLEAAEAAAARERFVLFVAAPEPEERYVSWRRRTEYYNRLVHFYNFLAAWHFFLLFGLDRLLPRCAHRCAAWLQAQAGRTLLHTLAIGPNPSAPPASLALCAAPQVALPLALDGVQQRLRAGYYRQPEALARWAGGRRGAAHVGPLPPACMDPTPARP